MTSLNSVLGNTRVNTLRVGWTQEDVSFGNPCFNANGRNQAACAPTLAFATFTDQQNATAQARVNDAIQIEDTMSWFLPGKKGDHDIKLGVQWQYSQSQNDTQDNLNGTFSFRPEQRAVRCREPAHVSGAVLDSRPRGGRQLQQVEVLRRLRAGQVEAE